MQTTAKGKLAEKRAEEILLIDPTRKLLCRNYRVRGGEIDLVLIESRFEFQELVFVEVRSRTSRNCWVDGVSSVDFQKRQRLRRAANHFLSRYRGQARTIRFDIMAYDGKSWRHVPNAW